ncbi:MAG: 50S ribosomal protein L21 [Patescibacteria group bacterium]
MSYAVVKIGGKQYLVSPGMKLKTEKLKNPSEEGGVLKFDEVLLYADGEKIEVGRPRVSGAAIKAEFLGTKKDKKIIVFHYHSKTRLRKKRGHRQPYSEIIIKDINPASK